MDPAILPWLTGGGGAIVVLALLSWAFFTGKLHSEREFSKLEKAYEALQSENDQLRDALDVERRTSDEAASAARIVEKLLAALTSLAIERRSERAGDIPAKDLGL